MSDDRFDDLTRGLGRVVREERTARGMSPGAVARASGLSKTLVSRIEAGDGNPSVETLWRLSRAFDVPLGTLLEPEDGPLVRLLPAPAGRPLAAQTGGNRVLRPPPR